MKELSIEISKIRGRRKGHTNPREYVSCWSEEDVLNAKAVNSFVIVLRTRGCYWAYQSGCSMCGYINDACESVTDEEILFQLNEVMKRYNGQEIVKIYTSGSFFDDREVSVALRKRILERLKANDVKRLILESRPEFITSKKLLSAKNDFPDIEVAVGLESANDFVLEHSVNKGFTFKDYVRAAKSVKGSGLRLRTYILIKPPFLTEQEAITDAVRSARKVNEYTDIISFNPVNVQKYTLVERLWRNREYRAPWLWSVVEVLKQSAKAVNARLICAPTAGGMKRGAHNCGKCDERFLKAIKHFSLNQNINIFNDLDCECKEEWLDLLELQGFTQSSMDINRIIV